MKTVILLCFCVVAVMAKVRHGNVLITEECKEKMFCGSAGAEVRCPLKIRGDVDFRLAPIEEPANSTGCRVWKTYGFRSDENGLWHLWTKDGCNGIFCLF